MDLDPTTVPLHKPRARWRRELASYEAGREKARANAVARAARAASSTAPVRLKPAGMPEFSFLEKWSPTPRLPKVHTPREIEIDAIRDAARLRLLDRERAEFEAHAARRAAADRRSEAARAAGAARRKLLQKQREYAARKIARALKRTADVAAAVV